MDDHLFFWVQHVFIQDYNQKHREWNQDIVSRGEHQEGGRIWFGGRRLEEFDEDCAFLCRDLSGSSAWLMEDVLYAYNFDNIDVLSQKLGIPWEVSKDRPFANSTTYIGFNWDIKTFQVSLADVKKEKYLRATEDLFMRPTHTLEEVEKLYGKLLHASLVRPMG